MIGTLISAIIAGAIIGALARLVLPGKQNISIPITIGLGILGSLIGSFIFHQFSNQDNTKGVDWIALILGVIVAAVLIVGYERFISGRTRV
ncbi:GlsB/YeaQ/YmgE family stress response membrane protein [Antrihabitans cavernicola]|uniref:GlsB/YeaQ/YmgE family stress response membrane protein n=1 Tax=Antrihabitans cavernicola TaxID=2495913 RepID=A0A5A7S7Q5_9NOCA|nr:GlsB/YeaQ/YmgE family stress response membrane protein [Spelaeibacter cavernicola]KAA0022180.1 GlsB/YeaQ/YmgE family stress response membrane protein [Spelaeibacter cavernicola]